MRSQGWKVFACVAAIVIGSYQVLPEQAWVKAAWQIGVGYATVLAIVAGVRRFKPADRLPWWCFAVGIGGNATGTGVTHFVARAAHNDGFPSLADPWWLSLYPACALGLALVIRRRFAGHDWAAMVDTTTVTTGLGLLAWVFVIQPAAADNALPLLARIVQVAYPVGDIVLLAMTARLMRGGGSKGPAYWFMTGSLSMFLLGDASRVVLGNLGLDTTSFPTASGRSLDMVFLAAYALFGVAALHPGARAVSRPSRALPPRLSRIQLVLLTLASMVAPAVLLLQLAQGGVRDGVAIAVGSAALFSLVVTRMAQLVREVEKQARYVRELARQDELTGLPNRRAWNDELPRAVERSRRDGAPLCVAVLDLDYFKPFTDRYGHAAGDRLLKEAAAAWSAQVRVVDTLARFGGEKFVMILPGADPLQVTAILIRVQHSTPLGQTFSGGIACWDGSETSDQLIVRADAALSAAKAAGRNQFLVSTNVSQTAAASAGA